MFLLFSLQKRNETASDELRWVVAIKHDPLEEQPFTFVFMFFLFFLHADRASWINSYLHLYLYYTVVIALVDTFYFGSASSIFG